MVREDVVDHQWEVGQLQSEHQLLQDEDDGIGSVDEEVSRSIGTTVGGVKDVPKGPSYSRGLRDTGSGPG